MTKSLASKTTLLAVGVAAGAVAIAFLASFPLLARAGDSQARRNLARQADLITGVLDRTVTTGDQSTPILRAGARRLVEQLRITQGITVVRVGPRGTQVGGVLPPVIADRLRAGQRVSTAMSVPAGGRDFIEGRPLDNGAAVALLQPVGRKSEFLVPVQKRLALALVVGMCAAGAVGWLLARRVSRPLRAAAAGAHRLAAGERGVIISEGSAGEVTEVAEIAAALGSLDTALTLSERRQRDFLLSVSHELRTPLTSIHGFAEALEDGIAEDPAAAGRTIKAESVRLERLVSDLLDLARLDALDFKIELGTIDLSDVVRSAQPVWEQRSSAVGCELRVELPSTGELLAHGDAGRLRQVLDGLADNALRVAPSGSVVVLSAFLEPSWAVLQVRDAGPGLTEDDCRVAFERSELHDRYRGSRRVGTGIGLALVAGLVERMHGTATAGQAPEGGAAFTIRLPRV